jgi:hypothetical protein
MLPVLKELNYSISGADPGGVRPHPRPKTNIHFFLLHMNVFAFRTFLKNVPNCTTTVQKNFWIRHCSIYSKENDYLVI